MRARELIELGVQKGEPVQKAFDALKAAMKAGMRMEDVKASIRACASNPEAYEGDPFFKELSAAIRRTRAARGEYVERKIPAPYRRWGEDIDAKSLEQIDNACRLPVSVVGALMPDAHVGYGLPIGGVLATRNAVIPYAVGVDIACRMRMTVLDIPADAIHSQAERLRTAIERSTKFGVGAHYQTPKRHPVMDDDWKFSPVTRSLKDKAWRQLGTSGSGNHFVEFGELTLERADVGLQPGVYLALLSHSGSRGTGGEVASHYSRVAQARRRGLPRELIQLAWLDLSSEEGQEYWMAMSLMGRYAAANHELIHRGVVEWLGANVLLDVENHHNFAWRETHFGEELVVHRKGATPAAAGVLGVIPGSMAAPGFLVRGKGNPDSLNSAAHGAGRRMSRKAANASLTWDETMKALADKGVELISAGLDESPMAYKDINSVMAAQADLVETVARFDPRIVKMAPSGERPED